MNLRDAAQQALEALEYVDGYNGWVYVSEEINALSAALADTQDWDEIEALRASLREHMAEIHRLRAAGRHALEALEEYQQKGAPFMSCDAAVDALRAALEPVTDYHGLEQDRAVVISNLLAHFGITSADSDVNVAYLHKQLDNFLTASIDCNKERDKLPPPLKIETCEYPWCLSTSGCGRQCPEFPRDQSAITGETSDVPETNFGNMAQTVDSKESDHVADTGKTSDHFPDATKMVATSQESRQVEPVAYMMVNDAHSLVPSLHFKAPTDWHITWEAIPLYTTPPKRKPLTEEEIMEIFINNGRCQKTFARAIERAHGLGGEE